MSMDNWRVLHIAPVDLSHFDSGPSGRPLWLARSLRRLVDDYALFLVSLRDSGGLNPGGIERAQPADIVPLDIVPLNKISVGRPYVTVKGLSQVISRFGNAVMAFNPSVVIVHNVGLAVALPALFARFLRGIPIVIDYMDVATAGVSRTFVATRLEKTACRHASLVVAISSFLEERARRAGCRHVIYIPPLVNTVEFRPKRGDESLRNGLGLADKKVIVFAGYWWDLKGVDLLMQSLRLLITESPDVRLLLLGGHDVERARFARMAMNMGIQDHVVMTGPVPHGQVSEYLALADVAVAPFKDHTTNRAAGPTKIAEYLACGKPVVATNVGDLPRLVGDGESGVIVPPSAVEIAKGIAKLLRDEKLRTRMGRMGRQFAERHLDIRKRAPDILSALSAPA